MSKLPRRRIDASVESHAWLKAEALRRGTGIGELLDLLVQEMAGNDYGHGSNEQAGSAAADELTGRLEAVVRRVNGLVEQISENLPRAVEGGFNGIKDTILKTGGTGHLRNMLTAHDETHTRRLDQLETTIAEERKQAAEDQTTALANLEGQLGKKIDRLTHEVAHLRGLQTGWWRGAAAGAVSMAALPLLLYLLLPGTQPGRWLAIRLTGETTAIGAAYTLAGDGRMFGASMASTKALLKDPRFRADYTRCLTQARAVKTPFSCNILVPPLRQNAP